MFETVKLEQMEDRMLRELRTEAEMMERVSNHPNIVKFVGAVTKGTIHDAYHKDLAKVVVN